MKEDCTDCEFLEWDDDGDVCTCTKGHELLVSYDIPDDCHEFVGGW